MKTLKTLIGVLALMFGAWVTDAVAAKTFFCKATIASIGDPSPNSLSGQYVYDLGTVGSCTDVQYATNFKDKCQNPANTACSTKASADSNFNSAAFWCAMGVPDGATIRAYAAVGPPQSFGIDKGKYITAQTKGVLTNTPAVTQTTYDCNAFPGTWLDQPSTGNGGHARCVRDYCQGLSGVPAPPAWTSIGPSWQSAGAAWITSDKANIWYGVPANATSTIVSPAQCSWR